MSISKKNINGLFILESLINWAILFGFLFTMQINTDIRLLVLLSWTIYSIIYVLYYFLKSESFILSLLKSKGNLSLNPISSLFEQSFLWLIYLYIIGGAFFDISTDQFFPFSIFVNEQRMDSIIQSDQIFINIYIALIAITFFLDICSILIKKKSLLKIFVKLG